MSREIKGVRPDQRWAHTIAMHGPCEGAGKISLRRMRLEHFAFSIGLRSVGEQRPFHALEGQHGSVRDPQVQYPAEVRRAAFQQMVLCQGSESIATVLDLNEPQRDTHSQERFGGTTSEL